MQKKWRFSVQDVGAVADLARAANISPVIAQLLVRRGLTDPAAVASFLDPKLTDLRDPELLPGVTQAADLLHESVQQNKPIVIYGDYDADGMTSTAILYGCLKLVGADVIYYLPNRLEDGYGLNCDAIRSLAKRGRQVIVTVDCGIGSVVEADLCNELGLQLIVTDHHQFGEQLPKAAAIVHPRLPGSNYPFAGLCGAGVAFKLAWAICQRASNSTRVRPELREYLMNALGLAALGTVADVVPLVDENRTLVRHGLISLLRSNQPGMRSLLVLTKLDQKKALNADDIGFTIAPRLNAAGRLGQAQLGVELLTTTDPARAEALATYIDKLNGDRDTLERSILLAATKQAKEQIERDNAPALVLASTGWHQGVIGVVAGRIAERYNRPAVIISLDNLGVKPGTGSARSPSYLNLHEALTACSDHLVSCGGHAAAAGLRVEEKNIAIFRAAFCEYVAAKTGSVSPSPEVHIDAEAPLGYLDLATVLLIEKLAPFGSQNPRPVFCATNVQIAEPPTAMGPGGRHFSGKMRQHNTTIRSIAFGQGEWVEKMKDLSINIDIAFRPVVSEFRGFQKVELQLTDWRPSQIVPAPHALEASTTNPSDRNPINQH